jgi:hypothetical protein
MGTKHAFRVVVPGLDQATEVFGIDRYRTGRRIDRQRFEWCPPERCRFGRCRFGRCWLVAGIAHPYLAFAWSARHLRGPLCHFHVHIQWIKEELAAVRNRTKTLERGFAVVKPKHGRRLPECLPGDAVIST